jgi:hypothetical protein
MMHGQTNIKNITPSYPQCLIPSANSSFCVFSYSILICIFILHSTLARLLTRLHLPSGRRSNRVRFAAGEEDFRFLVASRLVLGSTSFLSKEYRKLFSGNKTSGVFVENFLVIFLISSKTVCAGFLLYVSLLQKFYYKV